MNKNYTAEDVKLAINIMFNIEQQMNDVNDWNVSIDKILEHIEEIKKFKCPLSPERLMWMHEVEIITPSAKGQKKLDKMMKKINKLKNN